MKTLTRRDLLKTSLLAPAVAAAAHEAVANGRVAMTAPGVAVATGTLPAGATPESPGSGAGRERLLLDFGWRFHFGHADDPAKDLGFGGGRSGNFQKTGNFLPASALAFDDSDWRPLDLPHDWAVELPFENDPVFEFRRPEPI
jgi:beta-galactosidase